MLCHRTECIFRTLTDVLVDLREHILHGVEGRTRVVCAPVGLLVVVDHEVEVIVREPFDARTNALVDVQLGEVVMGKLSRLNAVGTELHLPY